ncbi:hypothetical protein BC834DRAFT_885706 [Gloeopeniophorella convolvens]|nr:hypothetical protein BC834DRAFT_885706 [Gloeopeniophorella convolvens]
MQSGQLVLASLPRGRVCQVDQPQREDLGAQLARPHVCTGCLLTSSLGLVRRGSRVQQL